MTLASDALPLVLTVEEVAELLRCSRTKAYLLAPNLPGAFRVGTSIRVERDPLLAAIRAGGTLGAISDGDR
jgi:excisionase family DNA binding protein